MPRHYSAEQLRSLRNDVNITHLISRVLELPCKESEGTFRFLCPLCSDFHSATNPNTNLARCFRCQRNFNPIDLVMIVHGSTFVEAVDFLIKIQHHL
jgi:hypothetical protein